MDARIYDLLCRKLAEELLALNELTFRQAGDRADRFGFDTPDEYVQAIRAAEVELRIEQAPS